MFQKLKSNENVNCETNEKKEKKDYIEIDLSFLKKPFTSVYSTIKSKTTISKKLLKNQ